jgi:hypothetical protein
MATKDRLFERGSLETRGDPGRMWRSTMGGEASKWSGIQWKAQTKMQKAKHKKVFTKATKEAIRKMRSDQPGI